MNLDPDFYWYEGQLDELAFIYPVNEESSPAITIMLLPVKALRL